MTAHIPPAPLAFNMTGHVLAAAKRTPEKPALCDVGPEGSATWSYAALEAAVLGTATGLLETGLCAGDRLLMRLGNTVEFPILYLAAIAVDILPVPTSPQLTASEVARLLPGLGLKAMAVAEGIATPPFEGLTLSLQDLRGFQTLRPADIVLADPNRPGYIVYTSGTSGKARGVIHAHRAVWARQMMQAGWNGLRSEDRLLHAGAFNWTYTMGTGVIDPLVAGATSLIPAAGLASADLAGLIETHDVTIFAAAPGVYRQLLRANPGLTAPNLRHGLSAGEKMAEPLRAAWQAATGTEVHEAYGMSECSTFISGSAEHLAAPGTMGRPQDGRRVELLGDDGGVGEIAVHESDPGLMLGYLDSGLPLEDGWFRTGDLARRDQSGDLIYEGRRDDMMNAGGFRVSPLEVEMAFRALPQIEDCAAVEREVKPGTKVIALFYEATTPQDPVALTTAAKDSLAPYKMPRIFEHCSALPRSSNGKIDRRALRSR